MLALIASTNTTPICTASTSADEAKLTAADLFASGDHAAADACLGVALAALTSELERLALEANSLRSYRAARRAAPNEVETTGCIVDENGASVCLLGSAADAGTTGRSSAPQSIGECMNDPEGTALMQRAERGEIDIATPALDSAIVHAVQRHWWSSARAAVNLLRNSNTAVTSETRRVVNELRDEAGGVLNLMRQTKMDEATIHCACMWAQGYYSVHINVKFASRLDAPVTVLNVDNEVVHINETHLSFSGIGRQKPKRYVVDLALFGRILANESTWSFGSVGTIKFVLKKEAHGDWDALTAPNSTTLSKTRVWWEKQEQVEAEDRKVRAARAEAVKEAKREEERKKEEAERKERERAHAEELELQRAEQAERRAQQLPHLERAIAAIDAMLVAMEPPEASEGSDTGAAGATTTDAAYEVSLASSLELLKATGQDSNDTAIESSRQMLDTIKSLGGLDRALTGDALQTAVEQYKSFCESVLEPAPQIPKAKEKKKKGAKKKSKKK